MLLIINIKEVYTKMNEEIKYLKIKTKKITVLFCVLKRR